MGGGGELCFSAVMLERCSTSTRLRVPVLCPALASERVRSGSRRTAALFEPSSYARPPSRVGSTTTDHGSFHGPALARVARGGLTGSACL
jgi:hypothetical protein